MESNEKGKSADKKFRVHTIEEARALSEKLPPKRIGRRWVFYHRSLDLTEMIIQLNENADWYLTIYFFSDTGQLDKYSLDFEGVQYESHYHFKDELSVRKALNAEKDNDKYLDEIMILYMQKASSEWLMQEAIEPFITAQFHYD